MAGRVSGRERYYHTCTTFRMSRRAADRRAQSRVFSAWRFSIQMEHAYRVRPGSVAGLSDDTG